MLGQAFYGDFLREIFACNHIPAPAKESDHSYFTQQSGGPHSGNEAHRQRGGRSDGQRTLSFIRPSIRPLPVLSLSQLFGVECSPLFGVLSGHLDGLA
jgi:hypothetical protein